MGADALLKRLEWSAVFGRRDSASPTQVAASALGPLLSSATSRALEGARDRGQAMALLLGSPEFQRR